MRRAGNGLPSARSELALRYGLHRVLDPAGAFPQPAFRLDSDPRISDRELLVDVERLNLDSASFRQIREACGGDRDRIAAHVAAVVSERGKMHNPVTGSGGMLVGRVAEVGTSLRETRAIETGARIASLISLTLTPLRLARILDVDLASAQIAVEGTAVLFESSPFAILPDDIDTTIALAALDVAGAPSRTAALVRPGDHVAIVGAGGTSGLLSLHEARKHAGVLGTITAIEQSDTALADVAATGLADHLVQADATDALGLHEATMRAAGGEADITINLVNVPGSELGTILITSPSGTILFFSMATSFTQAALGAEGLGRETTMLIGNGHMPDQGATALQVLRENATIREIFARRHAHAADG